MSAQSVSTLPENEATFLSNIVQSLENSYKAGDKAIRKEAETYLYNNQQKSLENIQFLLSAVKQQQLSKELNNALLIYIRNSIIALKTKKLISKEAVISIIKTIVTFILDISFPRNCLKEMNQIFEEIINYYIVEENEYIVTELITFLHSQIEENKIAHDSYSGLAYIYENILCCSTVNKKNSRPIIESELKCSDFMLKQISNILDLYSTAQLYVDVRKYIDSIKVIFGLLLNISVHSQKTFHNSDYFAQTLTTTFFDYGIRMLDISYEDKEFNCVKMKTKIMRYIISFLPLLPEYINDKDMFDKHLKLILYCVHFLEDQNNLNEINKGRIYDRFYEIFANQLIIYLNKTALGTNFKIDFDKHLKAFTKNSIFPLLISNEREINDIEDDEEGTNYANYIYDVIQTRKGKYLKVSIAKFIINACKTNNTYQQFIIEYAFNLIAMSTNTSIGTETYDLMSKASDIQKIETSFLVLCIISNRIKVEEDIKPILDFSMKIFGLLGNKVSSCNILKERICLFISVYIDKFLTLSITNDFFIQICEFLFFNIFNAEKPIAKYESFEAVKNILTSLSELKIQNNITPLITKYIHQFISYTKEAKTPLYFDILNEICSSITNEENMLQLVQILFSRILTEISPRRLSHSSKNEMEIERSLSSQYKVIINKCFYVLRAIFNNSSFIIKYFPRIEEMINPLLIYMKYPTKIDFDDDIVIIITIIIKALKSIPQIALKLLCELPLYLRKNKGLMPELYELLNYYIIYSNSSIESNEDYSRVVLKIFKKSFVKDSNSEISPYLGASLMQIWFLHSKNISLKVVIDTLLFANEQLQNIFINDKSSSSDISLSISTQNKALSLLSLLFVSFVNYPVVSCNNLKFDSLLRYLELQELYNIYSPYQVRMLIIGMCSIIQNETIIKIYSNIIPQIMNYCFSFLKKLKKCESIILKKKTKGEMKLTLIDSDEEDNEEDEGINEDNKEQEEEESLYEYKEMDERGLNSYKTVDEFRLFRESVQFLQSKFTMVYNQWQDEIDDIEMVTLKDIINTTRIAIETQNDVVTVPRKILRIKKSTPNSITQNMNI